MGSPTGEWGDGQGGVPGPSEGSSLRERAGGVLHLQTDGVPRRQGPTDSLDEHFLLHSEYIPDVPEISRLADRTSWLEIDRRNGNGSEFRRSITRGTRSQCALARVAFPSLRDGNERIELSKPHTARGFPYNRRFREPHPPRNRGGNLFLNNIAPGLVTAVAGKPPHAKCE